MPHFNFMKMKIKISFICFLSFTVCYGQPGKKNLLKTSVDSFSYSLGIEYAKSLTEANIEEINMKVFTQAFEDIFHDNEKLINPDKTRDYINQYFLNLNTMKGEENLQKGKAFLEKNKKTEGVIELPSGLQYKIIAQGDGPKPSINDKVLCHYKGTLIDGTVFDSSYDRGQPIDFPLNGVIKGWSEALQLMPVGSKWILYIPPELAYGEKGAGNVIGPNETLIFEVELISIK